MFVVWADGSMRKYWWSIGNTANSRVLWTRVTADRALPASQQRERALQNWRIVLFPVLEIVGSDKLGNTRQSEIFPQQQQQHWDQAARVAPGQSSSTGLSTGTEVLYCQPGHN